MQFKRCPLRKIWKRQENTSEAAELRSGASTSSSNVTSRCDLDCQVKVERRKSPNSGKSPLALKPVFGANDARH
ncbi:hypothetical protein TNCV_4896861 [Trichonephila clavipes]|uniref:Uncharacterized protein n=1 Tax=Trichonephila clavipes TaxID=2585209 RepID=A0A8X6VWY6_TRICX|nr:hypothetical protein TNCV_4896861 [Trichonephila clavipes]